MNVIFHWSFSARIVLPEFPCMLWDDNTAVGISRMCV